MPKLRQGTPRRGNFQSRPPKRPAAARPASRPPLAVRPLLDQAILHQLPLAVIITRASDHRVVLANPAAGELFGIDQLEGQTVDGLQRSVLNGGSEDGDGRIEHPLRRAVLQQAEIHGEQLHVVRNDGQRLEVLVHAQPIYNRAGDVVGAMGVFENVTRLRLLERMREDVLAIASHEIRGALSSLKGWADYAERKARDASDREVMVRTTQEVSSQISRFSLLVQQLLDLSQLDEESITAKAAPADLRSIVDSAVRTFPGDVVSRIHVRRTGPVFAHIDQGRLQSVVGNLIGNALKYSDGPVTIRLLQDAKWVQLTVSDRGIGIPPEDVAHIFKRFYRASNSHSKSGSGLGLYICRRIVEQHGGVMRVRSQQGRGTIMGFALPRSCAPVPATVAGTTHLL